MRPDEYAAAATAYSSGANALTNADWTSIEAARQAGYLTVLSTQDSEDWRRPGTTKVIANSMPRGTAGQVLLMHDAGGDRSETVAALAKLIPTVKARGFTFETGATPWGCRSRCTRPA